MTDEHDHQHIHYTLEMNDRHWWGGRVVYTVVGVSSSQQGGELLIHLEDGGLWSVNYTGVHRLIARPDNHDHV